MKNKILNFFSRISGIRLNYWADIRPNQFPVQPCSIDFSAIFSPNFLDINPLLEIEVLDLVGVLGIEIQHLQGSLSLNVTLLPSEPA